VAKLNIPPMMANMDTYCTLHQKIFSHSLEACLRVQHFDGIFPYFKLVLEPRFSLIKRMINYRVFLMNLLAKQESKA
jgi:hypothetical protein